ncbi:MAG TPA: amidohydrolase [Chitinophagaceae bacterium]|nr:amidohydrolase [Chitinophagaceae bacterium]
MKKIIITFLMPLCLMAQKKKPAPDPILKMKLAAGNELDRSYDHYKEIALKIWDFAELGYKEEKSSALLQKELSENGFAVKAGVAGIPTAFEASFGSGTPVIGILAEYDALPGISQEAVPERKEAKGKNAGHACGHHVFGTASVAAGIALKKQLEANGWKGTVKVFGCPAEEGGSGKVYMTRDGVFNGVDVMLHWHPDDINAVMLNGALANKSAKFRFYGLSSHASMSPEQGRSALDGVEAMDMMVNMMREHIPSSARIHYVITSGGKAPNVVPDYAEVYYYVRHPDKVQVVEIFDRLVKAAEGAALGTGTTMKYEVIGGTHDLMFVDTLNLAMQKELELTGGVKLSAAELEFGRKIQSSFSVKPPDINSSSRVYAADIPQDLPGSTDVGDVSYNMPTVGVWAATWIPGTSAHSWQAVACGGTDIATKGMMVAAKAMTGMGIELFNNKGLVENAKKEFVKKLGDYKYRALLGDRPPALNYRD